MRLKIRPMVLLLTSLMASSALLGCGPGVKARSNAFMFADQEYQPRVLAKQIRVFYDEKPTRKYAKLARIHAERVDGSDEDAYEELRERAALMGADAIIELGFDAYDGEYTVPGNVYTTENKVPDKDGTTKTETHTTVTPPTTRHYTKTVIRGVAIRYLD